MLGRLRDEALDLVVATRHVEGGSMGEMSPFRVMVSRFGQRLSSLICRTRLSDPMSGYFVLTARLPARGGAPAERHRVQDPAGPGGVGQAARAVVGEVAYKFRQRAPARREQARYPW